MTETGNNSDQLWVPCTGYHCLLLSIAALHVRSSQFSFTEEETETQETYPGSHRQDGEPISTDSKAMFSDETVSISTVIPESCWFGTFCCEEKGHQTLSWFLFHRWHFGLFQTLSSLIAWVRVEWRWGSKISAAWGFYEVTRVKRHEVSLTLALSLYYLALQHFFCQIYHPFISFFSFSYITGCFIFLTSPVPSPCFLRTLLAQCYAFGQHLINITT